LRALPKAGADAYADVEKRVRVAESMRSYRADMSLRAVVVRTQNAKGMTGGVCRDWEATDVHPDLESDIAGSRPVRY
jgi:hypothetical protein